MINTVRLLNKQQSSEYVGVGTVKFQALVDSGIMPQPVSLGERKLWDKIDIDSAIERLKKPDESP